jgi:hypothetical protein
LPRKPNVEELRHDKDLEKLITALRYPADAQVRAQAAKALGELNNSEAVESLIRSSQLDPSAEVQTAARAALEEMFGNRAVSIIQAYPIDADEEPWIAATRNVPAEEEDEEDDEALEFDEMDDVPDDGTSDETEGWTIDDLGPLITILRGERDPRLRLRAAMALGKLGTNNMHAVEALAVTALWGESPSVRAAALQAMVKIYGDEQAEQVINTFREMQTGKGDLGDAVGETEEEPEGEPEEEDESQWARQLEEIPQPLAYPQTEPVIREEGGGILSQLVWIGIVILVIAGLVAAIAYFK